MKPVLDQLIQHLQGHEWKQCVTDAERQFIPKLGAFMEKQGYNFEAKVYQNSVELVKNE